MDEMYFKIMGIQTRMQKNTKMSKAMKAIAVLGVFCSFCFGIGASSFPDDQHSEPKIVWVLSIIALVALFIEDVNYIKKNKAYEFEIYRLEVQDLKDKKEIAEIVGEIPSDYILNKEIDKPKEDVKLPTVYYSVLLVVDVIIGILMIL